MRSMGRTVLHGGGELEVQKLDYEIQESQLFRWKIFNTETNPRNISIRFTYSL